MTKPDNRVYLASRSPRRRELLKQIKVAFELLLLRETMGRGADVDEASFANEAADTYVTRIAHVKAELGGNTVQLRKLPALPVLAADTIVVLEGEIMGKPRDAQHAREMLKRLSGKTHEVLTAVSVWYTGQINAALSASTVEFRELSDEEIRLYVMSGEPLDKAGAYAIQGRAAAFVRTITGSYSGIMGLPLYETAELLRRFNFSLL